MNEVLQCRESSTIGLRRWRTSGWKGSPNAALPLRVARANSRLATVVGPTPADSEGEDAATPPARSGKASGSAADRGQVGEGLVLGYGNLDDDTIDCGGNELAGAIAGQSPASA